MKDENTDYIYTQTQVVINPYPRQIVTTDNLGNVTGAYDNPKWAEWEKENKPK